MDHRRRSDRAGPPSPPADRGSGHRGRAGLVARRDADRLRRPIGRALERLDPRGGRVGEPTHVIDGNWPSWTPDGTRLLVTLGNGLRRHDARVVPVGGGAPDTLPIQTPNASEGSVSSLGEIAFVSSENDYAGDASNWNEDIYTIGPDGRRGPLRITNTHENDHWPPTWSPAGDWFAYTHDLGEQRSRIAIVYGTDGAAVPDRRRIDLFPAWRPEPAP